MVPELGYICCREASRWRLPVMPVVERDLSFLEARNAVHAMETEWSATEGLSGSIFPVVLRMVCD
jgi:hypothetical protein